MKSQNLREYGTNIKNIDFDVYFAGDGEAKHVKEANLEEEQTITLSINVKEKGVLNDGKIKINNANFEIVKDKIQNSYVKDVNVAQNEITLNQISYGNKITIEIPIKFKKQENFEDNYFDKENEIALEGTYKEDREQKVTGTIKTKIIWQAEAQISESQEVQKYIDLGEKILLQQNVTTQIEANKLPRENEKISINVPTLDEIAPSKIDVLLNGEKIADDKITYNQEEKTLEIRNEEKETWSNAQNEYKIIYTYDKESNNKTIKFGNKTITLDTKISTKLYTKDVVENQDTKEVEIQPQGSIISLSKVATNKIYKGYMYANVGQTKYAEKNEIEISDVENASTIELNDIEQTLENEQGQIAEISQKTLYRGITVNKQELEKILRTKWSNNSNKCGKYSSSNNFQYSRSR